MRKIPPVILLGLIIVSNAAIIYGQTPYVPSIGMSGSFYTFTGIKIPKGGVINSSDLFIVIYNYGKKPCNVSLSYNAQGGIRLIFNPNNTFFELNPGEHKRINVVIIVPNNTVPGTYKVAITASEVTGRQGGVSIVPAVTQDIEIRVVGEYSYINIYAIDPSGKIAKTALVRLYSFFKGRNVSIADAPAGELHSKVLPGDYYIRVYIAGDLVGEEEVHLKPFENKTVKIKVKIIFIELFDVNPIVTDKNELVATRLRLIVKNVYTPIDDARIVLNVSYNGVPYEERTLISSSILPKGRVEYTFDYIPETGWKSGNYTFTVKIYGFDGKLLAVSPSKWVYYEQPMGIIYYVIPLAVIPLLLIIWLMRRRRKQRSKRSRSGMD